MLRASDARFGLHHDGDAAPASGPAGSGITRVRREVGDVIPELFEQMIMFVISSEKDGFADAFYPRDDVRYLTIWKDEGDASQMREGLDEFRRFHAEEKVTAQ